LRHVDAVRPLNDPASDAWQQTCDVDAISLSHASQLLLPHRLHALPIACMRCPICMRFVLTPGAPALSMHGHMMNRR
jgi:hypothetical protein